MPSTSTHNDTRPAGTAIGTAALLDERAATREWYEHQAAAALFPRMLALLVEARAALGVEYCGPANSLAGRIDDMIHKPARRDGELVLESYGAGYAWFRA